MNFSNLTYYRVIGDDEPTMQSLPARCLLMGMSGRLVVGLFCSTSVNGILRMVRPLSQINKVEMNLVS